MNRSRRRNLIGWVLLSLFLGGILWFAQEPFLGLLVGGVVFVLSFFYDFSRGRYAHLAQEEVEETWREIVTQLLRGERKFRFRAQVERQGTVWQYRDALSAGAVLPEMRVLFSPHREKPEVGFDPLFSCYSLLRGMPLQGCTSYRFEEVEERMKQEAEQYVTMWWKMWKQTWWDQVPLYLRKTLLDTFERQ